MKKVYISLLFVIFFGCVSLFYNYQGIFFKLPQSVHKWRQSDCASIALNYYQYNLNFFKPETHNLTSDLGTTGKCCTSEIPILYYSVSLFYRIFGYHDFIYRIFNTFLFFLGLFYLFRLLFMVLEDSFWAIALSLLFFTSPVLVFYGNNYLSNSSALAFSIIGWYYFLRYSIEKKLKCFLISACFFLLAAAFKITALFSVFALAGVFILELSGIIKLQTEGKLFKKPVVVFASLSVVFLIIGSWIIYAHNYNLKHDCSYFSTNIFPIWNYSKDSIINILTGIQKVWLNQYFHKSVLVFLAVCLLFFIFFARKSNRLIFVSFLIILAETLIYFILQFWTFRDHDYYVIDVYILPVILIIGVFEILEKSYPGIFKSLYLKIPFLLLLSFNIYYAHQQINVRYNGWMNDFSEKKDLYSVTPYLRQIGMLPNDTIISIPDGSHVSLYLMNQKGWTEYSDARFGKGSRIDYNSDSAGISASVKKGAKYLVIYGEEQLFYKPYLISFCHHLEGRFDKILIFNLRDKVANYNLPERSVKNIYQCDAEALSIDQQWFKGENDSIFQAAGNQTSEFSHSGKNSCRVDSKSPFGLTIKLQDLKAGESFIISVWRKYDEKNKGSLIASSAPNSYYNSDYKLVEKEKSGWEKIEKSFFVPAIIEGQELVIYMYNPNAEPVYFDDMTVIRYDSILR